MMQQPSTDLQAGPSEVLELIERRDTVQVWLARLDEQRGKVSERVLSRVREDYQLRLRETLDALAEHRQVVREELDRATSRLIEAEEEHQVAVDELEEGRLRNMIGEIDDATWEKRRSELDAAVAAASAREAEVRAETQRLTQLLEQLDGRSTQTAADSAGEDRQQAFEDRQEAFQPAEEEDTWLDEPLLAGDQDIGDDEVDALEAEESAPLLGGVDGDVVGVAPAGSRTPVSHEDVPLEDTTPKPGLKCGECGYTNDLSAWFCGVCGADIG